MQEAAPTLDIDAMTFCLLAHDAGLVVVGERRRRPRRHRRVTVEYTWQPLTPIVGPFLTDGKLTMRVESAMKNESKWE